MKDPRSILITGASSGIGEALAMAYAGPGISLALSGRDAGRLETAAAACRQRGAAVQAKVIDVADRDAMARWIEEVDRAAPIDLVVANAGIGVGTADGFESEEQTRSVFGVNVGGAFNTVLPLVPKLAARRRGQIALVSSLASFRGSRDRRPTAAARRRCASGARACAATSGPMASESASSAPASWRAASPPGTNSQCRS